MKLLKKLTPKALIFWLIGDKAGNSLVAIWNWLWGIPIESGGKIAVESARESLESMQKSLAELTESVAQVVAAQQSAQAQYEAKKQEHTNYLQQAVTAQKKGLQEAARLAMVKVLSLEKILSAMKDRVDNAEKVVIAAKEKLRQEQEKIEHYKLEMSNLKAISSMNEALGKINEFDSSLNLNNSRDRFEDANEAIKDRYRKENAYSELSENYSEKLAQEIDFSPIFYILLGLIGWFLFPQILAIFAPKADNNPRMSYGNHLLIKTNSNTTKESAIAAIAQGDHQEAEQLLQKSLAQHPNDPESVIYLSNLQTGSNPFKIAVIVPATTNPNVAQEILRGVASAQTQINQQGGINGRKLMVIVVNDDNQPQISKEVASELVKNPDIIAVIGHNDDFSHLPG